MCSRSVAGLKCVALRWLGASVGVPGLTVACLCDEICHSGEVYSDEHEVCVDSEITGEAQTETLRRDR